MKYITKKIKDNTVRFKIFKSFVSFKVYKIVGYDHDGKPIYENNKYDWCDAYPYFCGEVKDDGESNWDFRTNNSLLNFKNHLEFREFLKLVDEIHISAACLERKEKDE